MHANKESRTNIKQELACSALVRECAMRHNAVGDLSSMKVCYLLRHHPNLSVSEIAELVGLSVSATSRCLAKLKEADIVSSTKVAQSVYYQLQKNNFTKQLMAQMGAPVV